MRTKHRFKLRKLLVSILSMVLLVSQLPAFALAESGDFSIDFAAAAPYSYDHLKGGGAFDDGTIGTHADVVESLEGGDFKCGDLVTYLVKISVNDTDSAAADAPQKIQLDFSFLADTTGQSGVALVDIKTVKINYGTIEDLIPGENSTDSGNSDDGGSTATLVDERIVGTLFTDGALLLGSITVDDLERGETVILRIDVKLGCKPGSQPTGNLQADLQSAWLIATGTGAVDPPSAIPGGAQTVPFKQINNLGAADIEIVKTVRIAGSADSYSDSVSVLNGTAVQYQVVVSNLETTSPPGAPLYDVIVRDDNGTPANMSDDFTIPLTGLTDIDEDGHADDLEIGATATGTIIRTITTTASSIVNTATASGHDSIYMPNLLTDADTATVLVDHPSILLEKTGVFVDSSGDGKHSVGDKITYTFRVENTSNVTLTHVTITDPKITVVGGPIASMAPGAVNTTTFTGVYWLIQADIDAGTFTNVATVTGTPPIGPNVTDTDDDTQNFTRSPAIQLEKTGTYVDFNTNGIFNAGDKITYTFTVRNIGNVTLTNVIVTDPKITVIGAPIASMAPGAVDTTTFTGTHTITQADIDAGMFTNIATVTGSKPGGGTVTDTDDDTQNFTRSPAIQLEKTGTYVDFKTNGIYNAGDKITYTFTVRNIGNVTLTNVIVTDPKITVIGAPIASMAPGAVDTTTFTGTHTITQADIDAGMFTNIATVTGSKPGGGTVTDTDDDTQNFTRSPAIQLEKTGTYVDFNTNGIFNAGDKITYTFSVRNIGNVTLTNVIVTDPKITVIGAPIASMAPGAVDTTTFTGTHTITQADIDAGMFTNIATVTGSKPGGGIVTDTDDDTQSFTRSPALELEKSGSWIDGNQNGYADVGETITYTFTVRNIGNTTLHNVTVTDPKVIVIGGPTTLNVGETDATTFSGSTTITQADIDAGSVYNMATADSDESGPDDDDETEPLLQNPALELEKSGSWIDGNQNGYADVGETITYTFTVRNIGNTTLHNVTVTDPKVTVIGGPTTLNVGETDATTFSGSTTITQADIDAGSVYNMATADSDESDDDIGDETVVLPQHPAIHIEKTTNGGKNLNIQTGTAITWRYVVTNTGNATLSNITVTDDRGVTPVYKSGDSDHDGKLDLNETWVYEAIGIAIDGAYANTGTATGKPPTGGNVSDDDANRYFGYRLGIQIQKEVANLTQNGIFEDLADLEEDETARYRLIVTNTSNVALENVIVSDTEAEPGTIVTIQGGGTRTFITGTGGRSEISLGTLAAGQPITLTYTYLTLHSDIPRSPIFNTATVTGHPGDVLDPEGKIVLTDSDEAAINVDAIPLAVSSISIQKQVRNQSAAGIMADLAIGYVDDVFAYVVTITNTGETLLSNVVLTDDQAAIGSTIIRISDSSVLTWMADGTGKASISIGSLQPGQTISYLYRHTAVAADEGKTIINTAVVKAVFIPMHPGYENVPLERSDEAAIVIQETPPTTGENDMTGMLGLSLLLAGLALGFAVYRHRRIMR